MRFETPVAVFLLAIAVQRSVQQDDGSDSYDDGSDDDPSDDSQDDCALISGHSCNANGICKYCAMCLQDGCIVSKSAAANSSASVVSQPTASCNTTQFGPDVYDWYGYCLSGGNDSTGDYCATSVECYQYRKTSNSSVSYVWQNLTCDASSCLLTTDRGQPPPVPGQLPPSGSGSGHGHDGSGSDSGHRQHDNDVLSPNSAAAIGLMVACSLIALAGLLWVARTWTRRNHKKRSTRRSVNSDDTVPSSAPPSFSSTPEMTQRHRGQRLRASSLSSLHSVEPLPSYFSPDPSPPKYEQAIVTQIRGLMAHGAEDGSEGSRGSSSSDRDPLPPPLWLPVYFTPNHSAFSFGRLRRHPPGASGISSSSRAAPNMDDDPMRAFWYHHQQQLEHIQPSASQQHPPPPNTSSDPPHRPSSPAADRQAPQ